MTYLQCPKYALQALESPADPSLPAVGETDPVLLETAAELVESVSICVSICVGKAQAAPSFLLEVVTAGARLKFLLPGSRSRDCLQSSHRARPRRCQPGLEDAHDGFVERDRRCRGPVTAIATATTTTTPPSR